jgi:hypothetical protein
MLEFATALLERVLDLLGANGIPVTIVVILVAVLLYSRKAMAVGSVVADWTSKLMVSVAVLLILLVSGIVTGVNVDRAFELVSLGFDWLSSVFAGVVA